MSYPLPPDVQDFVHEALSRGDYATEEELVSDAVRMLRSMKRRHERLRQDIQEAIDSLDRGEGVKLDLKALEADLEKQWDADGIPE
ncbi:MAG: hypothetical protein HYS13_04730 [Planctomycetia bacterium]|nr:hypothetical protein [Planctomycetia bacterium]